MKHLFARLALLLGLVFSLGRGPALAAAFTPGNLVVARVGDGAAPLSGAATAVFLLEYTPAGVLVQTIALPAAAVGTAAALTASGTATSELNLTRSTDGRYLVLTGYDAAVGTAAVSATTATATNRIVARVAADGTIDASTRISDAFAANNIRAAASADGANFYAVGGNGGVRYVALGSTGATVGLNVAPANVRAVNVFGGNVYLSSGSAAALGVSQLGSGLPTTAGQTSTVLANLGTATGSSPYAFYFADLSTAVAGVDVAYVADDRGAAGGIQKYSLVGTTWTLNGTIGGGPAPALRGLAGSTGSTGTVALAASAADGIYFLSDATGYNVAPTATLAAAPLAAPIANTALRGVAFAPVAGSTVPAPTVASFSPLTGPVGTTVTVTGTNFAGATSAGVNGTAGTNFMVMSPTSVMFDVAAGSTTGPVLVTTPGGTGTSAASFTVTAAPTAPTIASFSPTSGPVGTVVTVTGANLGAATAATVGGTAGTAFMVMSPNSVMFTVPAGATSGVIIVTAPTGTATSPTSFTVTAPALVPTLTSVSPARAVAGGPAFTLTVNGTNLSTSSTIEFRGVQYPVATAVMAGTSATVLIPAAAIATTIASFPVRAFNGTVQGTGPTTFSVVAGPATVSYEDFEQGDKAGYAVGPVALRSGSWSFTDALIGDLFQDRVNQAKAARLRPGGSIAMSFDKPNGAGTVTVQAANYGADTGAGFKLELSTNGGTTYTQVGADVTSLGATLATYSFAPNRAGSVRLRFVALGTGTTPRLNLDDVTVSNVTAVRNPAGPALAAYPNPTADGLTLALPGTALAARTATVRDLLGRRVAEVPVSAQAQVSLRGLPAGSYLLEVAGRTVRVTKE